MKYHILLAFLLAMLANQSFAQVNVFPYTENFESGLGGWSNIDGQKVNWRGGTGSAGRGDNLCGPLSAQSGFAYAYVDVLKDRPSGEVAITQRFDFSSLKNPILSFYAYCYFGNIDVSYLVVSVKGSRDIEWYEIYRNFENLGDDWHKVNVCLSEFAKDPKVQIKISVVPTNEPYANVAIDNLKIEDFVLEATVKNATCYDYEDGEVKLTPSGAGPYYEYSIDQAITFTNLNERTYNYTFKNLSSKGYPSAVRDVQSGCLAYNNTIVVEQPSEIKVDVSTKDILCYGYNTGEISIKASESTGNNTPYYYAINGQYPGETSSVFKNLSGGKYSVIVRNSKGCLTKPQEVSIGDDVLLSIDDVKVTDIEKCYGDKTGSVVVSASYGENGPLDYSLDGGKTYHNGQNRFTSLAAGTYNLVIKDNNQCTIAYSDPIVIKQPKELIYVSSEIEPVAGCYGDETGSISVKLTGGTVPYHYSLTQGVSYQNSNKFSNLAANTYIPCAMDAMGCKVVGSQVVITQPKELGISNVKASDVTTCYGDATGSIEIVATGGTGTLKYSLDGEGASLQNSSVFKNLTSGVYYPYVQDANGCYSVYSEVELTQPTKFLVSSITPSSEGNLCYGDKGGKLFMFAGGGTSPYYFTINDFATSVKVSDNSTAIISNIAAGKYTAVAKDSKNCLSEEFEIEITQPDPIEIEELNVSDVLCYAGKTGYAEIKAKGGTPSYSYGYSLAGENSYSFVSSSVISGLTANKYDFALKDAHNCIVYDKGYTINEPAMLDFMSVKAYDVSTCYGDANGGIDLNVKGGVKPYRYSIDDGATFQDNFRFENLKAYNNYIPLVVDANGCKIRGISTLVSEPQNLLIKDLYFDEVKGCKGAKAGSIKFSAEGGTGKLTYSVDSRNYQDNGTFSGLAAGKYKPLVYDTHGCSVFYDEIEITEPDLLVLDSVVVKNVDCYGNANGDARVYASGGRQEQASFPYSFYLNGSKDPVNYTGVFDYMHAGKYDFVIEDKYKCKISGSFEITQPEEFSISLASKNIETCHGDSTGLVEATVKGGVAPFLYSASASDFYKENTTGVFGKLISKYYLIEAVDAHGCKTFDYALIEEPKKISYSARLTKKILCHDDGLAEIRVKAEGGTGNFKFSIDGGENFNYTDTIISNLSAGIYNIKAEDEHHCTLEKPINIIIDNPSELTMYTEVTDEACFTGSTGKILAIPHGGTKPYLFSIDGEHWKQNSGLFDGLDDGTYVVTLKDLNDCTVYSDELIINRPDNVAGFTLDVVEGCSPLDVTITQDNYGLSTYVFSDGETLYDKTGPAKHTFINTTNSAQTYKISATVRTPDGIGCADTASATVVVYPQPYLDLRYPVDTVVWPMNSFTSVNMNKNVTSVHWDFGDGTTSDDLSVTSHDYETCGNYHIIFTQSDGTCSNTEEINFVIEGRQLHAKFEVDTTQGCQPVSVRFTNLTANSDSCKWDFGDGSDPVYNVIKTEHKFEGSGNYKVTLTVYGDCGMAASTSKVISVFPKPTADFIQNFDTLYSGQLLRVESSNSFEDSYFWNFGDGQFGSGRTCDHKYEFDGQFDISLIVTTGHSCSDTSLVQKAVTVINNPVVVFPDAFSPNGDGINDLFRPTFGDVVSYEIVILNRLGVVVYKSDKISEGWDGTRNGKKCPTGMYVWKAKYTLRDKSINMYKGHVFLLR